MKNYFYFLYLICIAQVATAQIINPKETAKRKATDRTNNVLDRSIDKGLDAVEEGIGSIFKKKDKSVKNKSDEPSQESNSSRGKDLDRGEVEVDDIQTASNSKNAELSTQKGESKKQFSATSKFDFVPGEKVIGFENFAETSVGDFPLGWNTNSSAEIITFDDSPEKWLFMSQDGFFQPDFLTDIPDNFTLEYDIFTRFRSSNILTYNFYLYASDNPRRDFSEKYIFNNGGIFFNWTGGTEYAGYEVYEANEVINRNPDLIIKSLYSGYEGDKAVKVHFSIWRQKNRLRLYVDQTKVLDIPQAFNPDFKYNVFKFGSTYMNYMGADNKDEYMVANIRYAVGAPDTRSKLITEGRFSTTGILFDVNSDRIKPSSEGTLKEIAKVLSENPTVKIKIIGHTDADGADESNLTLSEKRALSVKNTLAADFGIAADRMQTEGKGEAQPVDKNDTPQGKANNRRVEFVRL